MLIYNITYEANSLESEVSKLWRSRQKEQYSGSAVHFYHVVLPLSNNSKDVYNTFPGT